MMNTLIWELKFKFIVYHIYQVLFSIRLQEDQHSYSFLFCGLFEHVLLDFRNMETFFDNIRIRILRDHLFLLLCSCPFSFLLYRYIQTYLLSNLFLMVNLIGSDSEIHFLHFQHLKLFCLDRLFLSILNQIFREKLYLHSLFPLQREQNSYYLIMKKKKFFKQDL